MKLNHETSMEPHLQESIQEILTTLNQACTCQTKQTCRAALKGIATAIHAFTGETWTCELWSSGYVFINEDETECICTEL